MSEAGATRRTLRVSDALTLTALTCFAYVLTYRYQAGWLAYYQLPNTLVQFDLTSVFAVLSGMGTFLVVLGWAVMIVPVNTRDYLAGLTIILSCGLMAVLTYFAIIKRPLPVVALIVVAVFDLLVFAVAYSSIRGSWNKGVDFWFRGGWHRGLPSRDNRESDAIFMRFLRLFVDRGVHPDLLIFSLLVVYLAFTWAPQAGEHSAEHPAHLLTSRDDSTTVLLRVLGDRAILGQVSRGGDTLFNHYRIVAASELGQYHWYVRPVAFKVHLLSR